MRLKSKLITYLGVIWLVFTMIGSAYFIRNSLLNFAIYTAAFTSAIFITLYFILIKRLESLSSKLSKIDLDNTNRAQLNVSGNDELALIATQFNIISHLANLSREQHDQHIKDCSNELQSVKIQLQKKTSQLSTATTKESSAHNISALTHYDEVTDLPNHIFFNEILNKYMSHAKRHHKILAILYIEIDGFDNIVDLGKHVSDQVLRNIATRFTKTLRSEDILARMDGNEFLVLLNDIGKAKFASSVAEKLLLACALPMQIESHNLTNTCSIGICVYPTDGESLETMFNSATAAREKAKNAGGNRYQFYTHEIDIEAREYIQLDTALRQAISNNQMSLHYQPKLHIKNGNITGVEALLRWSHPTLGDISPATFIPLAEDTGMIMSLCEFVLREACLANKYWQDEGYEHITVGVNLSPKQFYHADIVPMIKRIIDETGLNPNYLELEIAERTVMDNIDAAATILESIKALNVQLSIDHFGAGYTSISHLKRFPVSVIKIDPSFIKGVPNIPNDLAITNAFIALAHNLGLLVVAEGVETAEQVQYLATQDCDIIQGYFLSHPLPAQKILLQFKKLAEEVLLK